MKLFGGDYFFILLLFLLGVESCFYYEREKKQQRKSHFLDTKTKPGRGRDDDKSEDNKTNLTGCFRGRKTERKKILFFPDLQLPNKDKKERSTKNWLSRCDLEKSEIVISLSLSLCLSLVTSPLPSLSLRPPDEQSEREKKKKRNACHRS